jgi:hypothetical protein
MYTDDAPAMFGARQRFCARVKKVNPRVKIFHCLLRGENLASKRQSEELDIVMKGNSLSSRIFSHICPDTGSDYMHLPYHSEVRWLSRVVGLQRLVALRSAVKTCLKKSSVGSKVLKFHMHITTSLPSKYLPK